MIDTAQSQGASESRVFMLVLFLSCAPLVRFRYQSAAGLQADLTFCLSHVDVPLDNHPTPFSSVQKHLRALAAFRVARTDSTGVFAISQKLYGQQLHTHQIDCSAAAVCNTSSRC
jgi:hypothetical protein